MRRRKKLVPLMPILMRLHACDAGCEWIAEANHKTFRAAYRAAPVRFSWWLVRALDCAGAPQSKGWMNKHDRLHDRLHTRPDAIYRRAFLAAFPPQVVERALYDFAVREGLA